MKSAKQSKSALSNGGKNNNVRVGKRNWRLVHQSLKNFLYLEIKSRCIYDGVFNSSELSRRLGHATTYVDKVLDRSTLAGLKRCVEEIEEKL